MIVVDAANVVGSRPTGWWRDRAGAARDLHRRLSEAVESGRIDPPVVVVLEGAARGGVDEGENGGIRVVHAPGSGDDTLVDVIAAADGAVLVSADRALGERVRAEGATVVGPRWLLERLG